ncbi:unnamed protein product [Aphanomyces euteiches]|nr:hypothetical protein Ae201684P_004841 [Aphanomyces euteiches]KAH9136706.1 hypothetical protein AeRB84_018286 [Aphanomyces euteiches]
MQQDAYELVGSTRSRLDQAERDRMDLKMEVAHLRERLLQRVGGDTTALELEEESFMMKKELMQMEQSLVEHREQLVLVNTRHEKALINLQKLDAAWKASVAKVQSLQETIDAKDKQLLEVDLMKKVLRSQEFTIQTLEGEAKQLRGQLATKEATVVELQADKKRMHVEFEHINNQLNAKAGVSKDAQREAESELHAMVEKCARLQGEANALREQVTYLQSHSTEVQTNATQLKSKLLQLTEEHATLQIHLKSSKAEIDRHMTETAFLKREVDRLQNELNARDLELLQHQQKNMDVQSAIEDTKKRLQLEEQARELQTRRMELDVEKKWRDQAHAYEIKLQAEAAALAEVKNELEMTKALQDELVRTLGVEAPTDLHSHLVTELNHKASLLQTVEKLRSKLAASEKSCGEYTKLQIAHTELEDKYNKTRQAMERILARKTKSGDVSASAVAAEVGLTLKENTSLLSPKATPGKRKPPPSDEVARPLKHVSVKSRYMQPPKFL